MAVVDRRPASAGRPLRVAFTCFYADWGHQLPLLKIAKAAQNAGHEVKAYLPDRTAMLAQRMAVPAYVVTLERDEAADEIVARALGTRGIFFHAYSGSGHTSLFMDPQVVRSTLAQLDSVLADLKAFQPDIVVGDAHVLGATYQALAGACRAAYVRNDPSGTLAAKWRTYTRLYGGVRSEPYMRALEIAGPLFGRAYRPAFYLYHFKRWRSARAAKQALSAKLASLGPPPTEQWGMSAGLTWIERRFLSDAPPEDGGGRRAALPPLEAPAQALAPDLRDWLTRGQEPVVYISMGSITGLDEKTYRAVAAQLVALGCRVVWSTLAADSSALQDLSRDPRFFIVKHVAQSELLRGDRVACFVTHAGAGSAQEALMGGTPVLSVPLHSDNGYISWLLERLGVGRRVWKRELGTAAFGAALGDVLSNPQYKQRAREIVSVLNSTDAEAQVVSFLEEVGARIPAAPNR